MSLPENTKNKTHFQKNVALATIRGTKTLTLRQKKATHTIQTFVREQFFSRNPELSEMALADIDKNYIENTNTTFSIPEEEMMNSLGYRDKDKYHSFSGIQKILEDLKNHTIYFDQLGIAQEHGDDTPWKDFSGIVASVERQNGFFRVHIPPTIVYHIVKPKVAFHGLISWENVGCKHAPEIMDLAMYSHQNRDGKEIWYELEAFKKMLGTTTATFKEFKHFNQKALKPALKDINENMNYELEVKIERGYFDDKSTKQVTHIRFTTNEKVNAKARSELHANSVSLSAIKNNLRMVGVSKENVDKVIDLCRDSEGRIIFPYAKYCTRKGHELKLLNAYKDLSEEKFEALFIGEIVHGKKEYWLEMQELLDHHVNRFYRIDNSSQAYDETISDIKAKAKKVIFKSFINDLDEKAYSFIKKSYEIFFEKEFKQKYNEYLVEFADKHLTELGGYSYYVFTIFIELEENLFQIGAYQSILKKKHFE